MTEDKSKTAQIFCNYCKHRTTHILRARNHRPRVLIEGEDEMPGDIVTSIWTCAGCDATTFEQTMMMEDGDEWGPRYFPPRSDDPSGEMSNRIEPRQFPQLSPELARLHEEVIKSFNAGCMLLCAVGLRMLIEGICVEKGITEGNLERKIDAFAKLVPNLNIIDALHALRFAGNDAAHDREALSRDNARVAIEFAQDLLSSLYELDDKAKRTRDISQRATFRSARPDSVQ